MYVAPSALRYRLIKLQEEMNTVHWDDRRWEQWCEYEVNVQDPCIREQIYSCDGAAADSMAFNGRLMERWELVEKPLTLDSLSQYPRAERLENEGDEEVVHKVTAKLVARKEGAQIELHFELVDPAFDEARGNDCLISEKISDPLILSRAMCRLPPVHDCNGLRTRCPPQQGVSLHSSEESACRSSAA